MKTKMMLAVGLVLLLAVANGYGQQLRVLGAKIPYPFIVGGKTLPAGQYEFTYDVKNEMFRVTGDGQADISAKVETRMAGEMHTTAQDTHLVFDMVGNNHALAEIWYPGDDGYLMLSTRDKHNHAVINVPYSVNLQPINPESPERKAPGAKPQ